MTACSLMHRLSDGLLLILLIDVIKIVVFETYLCFDLYSSHFVN